MPDDLEPLKRVLVVYMGSLGEVYVNQFEYNFMLQHREQLEKRGWSFPEESQEKHSL